MIIFTLFFFQSYFNYSASVTFHINLKANFLHLQETCTQLVIGVMLYSQICRYLAFVRWFFLSMNKLCVSCYYIPFMFFITFGYFQHMNHDMFCWIYNYFNFLLMPIDYFHNQESQFLIISLLFSVACIYIFWFSENPN